MTTADSPEPTPAPPPTPQPSEPSNTPGLVVMAAVLVGGFVLGGAVMALLTRQTNQQVAELKSTASTLKQDLDRLRASMNALAVNSDRGVVLTFPESGFAALRTNAGALLVMLTKVTPLQTGMIVVLRVGNPQLMTYDGFSMTFEWDNQKLEQSFPNMLEPGQWATVQATLTPADPGTTKSVRITSASVDQIRVVRQQ